MAGIYFMIRLLGMAFNKWIKLVRFQLKLTVYLQQPDRFTRLLRNIVAEITSRCFREMRNVLRVSMKTKERQFRQ